MFGTLCHAGQSPQEIDCLPQLAERYREVRRFSERIAAPLTSEDCAIQSMPDVSPTRWHLAHTTWFFETFLLRAASNYEIFDRRFEYLFNSYYNSIGRQHPRSKRGLISRPGLEEILAYREHVDDAITAWLHEREPTERDLDILTIGLNHEQQHQELMLTDIKHVLSCNPLQVVYESGISDSESAVDSTWIEIDEDLVWVGTDSNTFAFDNERPRHRHFLDTYKIASHCVTNGEYLAFIEDGGYRRPELWLAMGWDAVNEHGWETPLYWDNDGDGWSSYTLGGRSAINLDEPVCHVSFFEADAYARWSEKRLPTEQEWEHAVNLNYGTPIASLDDRIAGHWSDVLLTDGRALHPRVAQGDAADCELANALGNLWEWTASQYTAYPGYKAPPGAIGEYNGKFMCNQFVLRGGSCATPSSHMRPTYRNFFPPDARWQFSGIRLAE